MYRQHFPDDPGMHNAPRQPGHYGDAYVHGDQNVRITYRRLPSFCERVRDSLVAFLVGLALLCVASGILFWNEGRGVQTAKSLDEGLRNVRSLHNIDVVFDENNGKLIHINGLLKTSKALYDELYGVAIQSVHLRRNVEMYQWIEEEHKREIKEGDVVREERTYSYTQRWSSDLARSSSFHNPNGHHNPSSFPVASMSKKADEVQVGSFYLSQKLISDISTFKKLVVNTPVKDAGVHLSNGGYYVGRDPTYPVVGDLRITFEYAGQSGSQGAEQVSVVGRQAGNQVLAYKTEAGDSLEILYTGDMSAEAIFRKQQANNAILTWALRFAGWLLMFIGFSCLTSIIPTLVDWLPIVREVISLGVVLMNVTLAISLSLTIIAIGWVWYRPWLGAAVLVMAIAPFILAKLNNSRRGAPPAYSAQDPLRSSRPYND